MDKKAMIAMSGGVDSTLAAILTKESGYDCIGATMLLKAPSDLKDAQDAEAVARQLDIPFRIFDFSDAFYKEVVDCFADAYISGYTPNPCIVCNRCLKFGRLLYAALKLGCEYVVTGHYARVQYDAGTGKYLLRKAADTGKDQSYFLYSLTQEQLSHVLLPLGEMKKTDVRQIVRSYGCLTAEKRESQDICFVPDGNYAGFIESYTGKRSPAGDFVNLDGTVCGRHEGIVRYTIGQRKGLGVSFGEPVYVVAVDPVRNTVTLGPDEALYDDVLCADHLNLICTDRIDAPMRCKARIRSRQKEQWATVEQTGPDNVRVAFDEPQRAITPGQAVVFYDDDIVVGGARICPKIKTR